MSSSEREAAYVIDGLMCNDEIKSNIHSTDTHGYSDLVFAITHLLGISFAPRLAKIKKRTLYAFEKRSHYQKEGYKILPDHTINIGLIEENWDDILRLVATIKLKENTASQILKRLSSYAKDHPLYQGLKEFGKLIKTLTEEPKKREELLKIITNGSIMTWIHINLLGEYDFRNKSASNEPIFDIEKILVWSA